MSHSEAPSRLTVGDRRSDLIRGYFGRAIGSFELEVRNMIDARMYPTIKYAVGDGQASTRIIFGGTAPTYDHGRARADKPVRTS